MYEPLLLLREFSAFTNGLEKQWFVANDTIFGVEFKFLGVILHFEEYPDVFVKSSSDT